MSLRKARTGTAEWELSPTTTECWSVCFFPMAMRSTRYQLAGACHMTNAEGDSAGRLLGLVKFCVGRAGRAADLHRKARCGD